MAIDHQFLKPPAKEIIVKAPVTDSTYIKKCEDLQRVITQQELELKGMKK